MSNKLREKLDSFASIGSAIGALIGVRLLENDSPLKECINKLPYYTLWYAAIALVPAIFSYSFCTCTHRKLLVYSRAGIGAFFGSLVGLGVGALFFCIMSSLGMYIFVPIFAATFSYLFHKREKVCKEEAT